MEESRRKAREVRDRIIKRDHAILSLLNSGSRKIRVKSE